MRAAQMWEVLMRTVLIWSVLILEMLIVESAHIYSSDVDSGSVGSEYVGSADECTADGRVTLCYYKRGFMSENQLALWWQRDVGSFSQGSQEYL